MSFMWIFEAGDFQPELIGWDDNDRRIEIMKVGGGTLGTSYDNPSEAWLIQIVYLDDPAGKPDQLEVTQAGTHWDILLTVIGEDDSDD